MLTKNDIQQLILEEENTINNLRDAAIKERDCMYEIGVFMHEGNVIFLKEALEGKISLTKANVKKLINEYEYQESLMKKREEDVNIDEHITYQCKLIAIGRVELLKQIYERFHTEMKSRISRKQKIIVLEKEIMYLSKKIEEIDDILKHEKGIQITTNRICCKYLKKEKGEIDEDPPKFWYCSAWIDASCTSCIIFAQKIKPTGYFEVRNELEEKKKKLVELKELERVKKESKSNDDS